jgi:MoxR-like ATPase
MLVNISSAKELVYDVLKAKLVPFLQSSPGIGKSSLAKQLAEENDLELIDVRLSQLDPTDLSGLPFRKGDKAEYLPMNTFPLEGESVPEGKEGFLLLLDEFNSAPMSVRVRPTALYWTAR